MKKQQLHNVSWVRSVCSQSQQLVLLGMRSSVCPTFSGSASTSRASSAPLLPRAARLHPNPLKHILKLLIPPQVPRVRFLNSFGKTAKDPSLAVRGPSRPSCHAGVPPRLHQHSHITGHLLTSSGLLALSSLPMSCGLGQPRALARCLQLKALMERVVTSGQFKGKSPSDAMLLVRRW